MGLQPQPLGFEGQRAAAGERVMEGRELVRIEKLFRAGMVSVVLARAAPAQPDLGPRLVQDFLVRGALPLHQVLDNREQALPLALLGLLVGEQFGPARRIVHHLGEDDGAGRGKRPAGPPEVECAGVPVPDGLLPGGGDVDRLERECDLDELLSVDQAVASLRRMIVPVDRMILR